MPSIIAKALRRPTTTDPLETWKNYLDILPWQDGQRDEASWNACLRAGSLEIDPQVCFDEVSNRITGSGVSPDLSKIRSQIQRAYLFATAQAAEVQSGTFTPTPTKPKPQYDPSKLEAFASQIDFDITPEWLEARSALTCWNRTPAGFLHALYEPGEKVVVFDVFKSQGCDVWEHPGRTGNLASLNYLQKDRFGVWFLDAPITGEWIELDRLKSEHNPTGRTRRAEENVTNWRYAVIESDKAPKDLWLRALVQLPLPISSITDSGDCSIHALIRVDASDKNEWDRIVRRDLAPLIVPIGADIGAMTAVRLTRLPNCWRGQTGRLQQLLYLDPEPDGEPIIESLPREAPGSAQGRWESALEVTQ